jgi:hypothetical protein
MEKLAGAVASAQVDLNPHQIDAALFAKSRRHDARQSRRQHWKKSLKVRKRFASWNQRSEKRRLLFDAQDDVDQQRDRFIADVEGKLRQTTKLDELFTMRWRIS